MKEISDYYSEKGLYLDHHKDYLSQENLDRDIDFIIKSLDLKKEDKCLDLQCAQGRITIELKRRGFDVDGLDASEYMLSLAKREAIIQDQKIDFFLKDLHNFDLPKKYTKVFLFFPDCLGLHFEKVLPNISKVMEKGGLFLYDHDSLYRLQEYFRKNPTGEGKYTFDSEKNILSEVGYMGGDCFYTLEEIRELFQNNGLEVIDTYGGWNFGEPYTYESPRLRVVARKIG